MNPGRTSWIGVLLLMLLVGMLGLLGILALANRDVYAPFGEELRCEDIGFRVLDISARERVGAPGSERSPRGRYHVVRLEVANHGRDGVYDLTWHHPMLIDASGRVVSVDTDATEVLRADEEVVVPAHIVRGERCVTPLVYDVPADAREPTLRIAWETAALQNLVDLVVHGDRRLLLGEAR